MRLKIMDLTLWIHVIYRDERLNTCTLTRFIKRYMNICNTKITSNRAPTWVFILFMRAQRPNLYSNRVPPRPSNLRGASNPLPPLIPRGSWDTPSNHCFWLFPTFPFLVRASPVSPSVHHPAFGFPVRVHVTSGQFGVWLRVAPVHVNDILWRV